MVEPLTSIPERMARIEERVETLAKADDILYKKLESETARGPDWKMLTPAIIGALAALGLLAERLARSLP